MVNDQEKNLYLKLQAAVRAKQVIALFSKSYLSFELRVISRKKGKNVSYAFDFTEKYSSNFKKILFLTVTRKYIKFF